MDTFSRRSGAPRRGLTGAVLLALAALGGLAHGGAHAAAGEVELISGALVVQYAPGATAAAERRARTAASARVARSVTESTDVVRVAPGQEARALAALRADPAVRNAFQDGIAQAGRLPDDPSLGLLWGLRNTGQSIASSGPGTAGADVGAATAWAFRSTGASVAIIDSGLERTHPDLACSIWTNAGEVAGNGLDDDANGFVDDVYGWDFIDNEPDGADDVNGHGTHVAGTVAACGDNARGVTGVAWSAPLMTVRVLGDDGRGPWSVILSGFAYAGRMGARVANVSIIGVANAATLKGFADEAKRWPATLFVIAAGNEARDLGTVDYAPCEASLSAANALCVHSTTNRDQSSGFSNYGAAATIAAPGTDVYSTTIGGSYGFKSGTSMATPHVAGTAALAMAERASLSGAAARSLLEGTADVVNALTLVPGKRRLNAASVLALADSTPPSAFALTEPGEGSLHAGAPLVRWMPSTDPGGISAYEVMINGQALATVSGSTSQFRPDALAHGSHDVLVRAHDGNGNIRSSPPVSISVDATPPTDPVLIEPAARSWHSDAVTLSWEESSDPESGVSAYRVVRDGTAVAVLPSTARTATVALAADAEQSVGVEAVNGVGSSAGSSRTVRVDMTPPTIPVLIAPEGDELPEGAVTFRWDGGDDPESGRSEYHLVIDGEVTALPPGTTSATEDLAPGPHTWQMVSVNGAGLESASVERSIEVRSPSAPPAWQPEPSVPPADPLPSPSSSPWLDGAVDRVPSPATRATLPPLRVAMASRAGTVTSSGRMLRGGRTVVQRATRLAGVSRAAGTATSPTRRARCQVVRAAAPAEFRCRIALPPGRWRVETLLLAGPVVIARSTRIMSVRIA